MNMENTSQKLKQASKFLSLLLRHKPQTIGLSLDNHGWAVLNDIDKLSQSNKIHLTPDIIKQIVETDEKQRYALNEEGTHVRANQGHSISVDLEFTPVEAPKALFHGTATRFCEAILAEGIKRNNRLHVHLSADHETAIKVGQRHGKPCIFRIDTEQMQKDGFLFYFSDNGVWLTEHVPSKYLELI